jgi:hypothetical protein
MKDDSEEERRKNKNTGSSPRKSRKSEKARRDAEQLQRIVCALEYLKNEAARNELDDVTVIIDSAFRLCLSIYYLDLRG